MNHYKQFMHIDDNIVEMWAFLSLLLLVFYFFPIYITIHSKLMGNIPKHKVSILLLNQEGSFGAPPIQTYRNQFFFFFLPQCYYQVD